MSTVFDITSAHIDDNAYTYAVDVDTIDVEFDMPVTNVEVEVTQTQTVQIEVPGLQGPPGLQNVYISETPPVGWGPEEEGFIWAQILA